MHNFTKKEKTIQVLTHEERLFMFLSSDINKGFCLFLGSVLPTFEMPNTALQTRVPLIHVLHGIIADLLKDILSKFVTASAVTSSVSLFTVEYHKIENKKNDDELVIGTATSKIVQTLSDKDKKKKLFTCKAILL